MLIDDIKDVIDSYFVMFALSLETSVSLKFDQVKDQHRVRLDSKKIYQKNIRSNNRIDEIMYFNNETLTVYAYKRYVTSSEYRAAVKMSRFNKFIDLYEFKFPLNRYEDVMDIVMIFENYYKEILT